MAENRLLIHRILIDFEAILEKSHIINSFVWIVRLRTGSNPADINWFGNLPRLKNDLEKLQPTYNIK